MNEVVRTTLGVLVLVAVASAVPLVDGVRQGRLRSRAAVTGTVVFVTGALPLVVRNLVALGATMRRATADLVGLLAAESVAAVVLLRLLADVPFLPVTAATAEPQPAPGRWRSGRPALGRRPR